MKGARANMKYGDRVLLKQYKNGNKLWGTVTPCAKCNRTGKVIWSFADHVCFDCNGKGWYYYEEREYTPENLAKKEAKEAAKRAQWEAEDAEREAKRAEEEARREAERLAEIERNRGAFVGNVGDKVQMEVTLVRQFNYEVPCFNAPWKTDIVTGYVFKTDDGNTLVWKTTGSIAQKEEVATYDECDVRGEDGKFYRWVSPEDGERITIKGTIKAHEEYNNVNQTILNRVKWIR
jgi:hypothetical protein